MAGLPVFRCEVWISEIIQRAIATVHRSTTDASRIAIDEATGDSTQGADLIPPNTRRHRQLLDSRIQADGELSDSDDEEECGRRDHAHHRDRDSEPRSRSSEVESAARRRFGIGVGILSAGAASPTQGAGPSGHTNAVRPILSGHLRRLPWL